jgi:puromycin-sensitive aminopeptidase
MCKRYDSGGATVTPGSFRLPKTVVPHRYDLKLHPNLDAARFTGTVTIDMEVTEPVNEIVLHATELLIKRAVVEDETGTSFRGTVSNGAGQLLDGSIKLADLKDDDELAVIKLTGTIGSGRWRLTLDFSGILNDKLHGFYRSTYKRDGFHKHNIAATQLCPNDARRAFPCFDEPDMKAVFSIALIVDERFTAVSNARVLSETLVPDSRQVIEENWTDNDGQLQYACDEIIGTGKKEIVFAPTIRMSTYLVCFVVGEFERTAVQNVDGTEVSIYYVPGKGHLTSLAMEVAAHSLRFYRDYFGIDYAQFGGKLDLIAVPDFPFGAMENFGCVTFRETTLLVDEATATVAEKNRVAEVVAHEIAHMWFGDLVTMKWWNGLWLNEAFATFMSYKCVDAWKPELKLWDNFAASRGAAFATDGLRSTRAIESEVKVAADALAMLDVITYEKGCSVLRMLEHFIGLDVFRDGIRHYLAANQFDNAETTDLWDAIEHVSGRPVRKWMDGWIFQAGHPVVSVNRSPVDGCITLSQQVFKYLPEADASAAATSTWMVPVRLRAKTASGVIEMFVELDNRRQTIFLGEGLEWLVVNADGNGVFRTRYCPEFAELLADNVSQLSVVERYNFVNDLWACVRSGQFTSGDYLSAIAAFSNENDPNVLGVVLGSLRRLAALLPAGQHDAFAETVRQFAAPIFARLGWTPAADETPQIRQLRGQLVAVLGTTGGDEAVQARARELFAAYKLDKASVPGDLLPAVVDIIAHTGGRAEYDEFKALRAATDNPQEGERFLYALAGFRNQELLRELLSACMTDAVRTQDAPFLIAALISHDLVGEETWQHVKDNWSAMSARFPETGFLDLVGGVVGLTRRAHLDDVREFFAANPVRGGGPLCEQYLEQLQINVLFEEREGPPMATAFASAS